MLFRLLPCNKALCSPARRPNTTQQLQAISIAIALPNCPLWSAVSLAVLRLTASTWKDGATATHCSAAERRGTHICGMAELLSNRANGKQRNSLYVVAFLCFLVFLCTFLCFFCTSLCLLDFTLACSLEHANALRRMRRAGDNTNTNTKHKKHNTHNGKRRNACHFIHTRQHTVCFTALHTASRYVWCASKGQDEAVVDFLLDGRAEQQLDELWT